MRTRMLVPLAILLLTAFLTIGIASAGELEPVLPAENMDEATVSASTGESLFSILLSLAPILSEELTEDDLGGGVDNRAHD